jgi:hypothetical protein
MRKAKPRIRGPLRVPGGPFRNAVDWPAVLTVRGIEAVGERQRRFRIDEEGAPAAESHLAQVAVYACRLLAENELLGDCRPASEGVLLLDLPETESTYFYDGIVFAALDAFNNPNKNPTITGLPPIE